ncbi:class I SAM-dependent methyltransferase [Gordonia sp. PKS22-38]|uniref:Class I SAM-dependent methyltransferase n=1 Tax=Gordonia prachuapensis TaxID=3115651 RepID=A0ABU7MW55_9ACTN|nr:class I SAM-dependent methyltransferase [Gordonia sp. PKS22-38]
MATRWDDTNAPKGDKYDERWQHLLSAGQNIHGQADLVQSLIGDRTDQRILDAGCGTGRVAIELRRRGFAVVGVDSDDHMLSTARRNGPDVPWVLADLAELDTNIEGTFELAVLAGNVMIFLEPDTEGRVLDQLSQRIEPGGLLVAGFSLREDRLSLADYDDLAERSGFDLVDRWSTWDRDPFDGDDYAVSVHRRR